MASPIRGQPKAGFEAWNLPMQHPDDGHSGNRTHCLDPRVQAVEIGTRIEGVNSAKRFRPVLSRAPELGLFIFAHPYYVGAKVGLESITTSPTYRQSARYHADGGHLMYSGAWTSFPI